MTDLGWGAYVNCKKKLERFLGRDIELEPERKDKKDRVLTIKDENKEKKDRNLEDEAIKAQQRINYEMMMNYMNETEPQKRTI